MDADDVARILDRANDLLEAGKPADALRCLAQVENGLSEEEDRVEAVSLRAWALSDLGNHQAALDVVERMLDQFPDSGRLHAARGVVLSNADDLEEARIALEQAFALDQDDEVCLANLGLVYEKLRDYEQALELYDRALMMGADIDWALQRKGAVQTELGDFDGAKQTLRRYLSLVPDDAPQWVSLGILYSDDEEYDHALECYREAERLDPDSGWLRLNWGVTAIRAGRADDAARQLTELDRTAGDTARPWLLRAFMLEQASDMEAAQEAYEQAVAKVDPQTPDDLSFTIEMAIDFYGRQQRLDRCRALLRSAYDANACTVELCEAYREANNPHVDEAVWFSVVVEADFRDGLDGVPERGLPVDQRPTRFLRNYQVIARDRDEATALVLEFVRQMGEQHARVREFVNDEPIEDVHLGIYEVERRCLVFIGD